MQTIQLSVQDSAYGNLMQFLGTFKNDEIKVLSDERPIIKDARFLKNQKELHETLRKIDSGETTLMSFEEFEERLNNCI